MSFELARIVPWGRSFDEYAAMFALTDGDLRKRILGCGDGPASFNAGIAARGGCAVSVDPLYRYSRDDIRRQIDATFAAVLEQTRTNMHEFTWSNIKSVDDLGSLRMSAMEDFLSDYPSGVVQGRYIDGELPHMPFSDRDFDLAVCSHLLFLYSEHLSEDFHVDAVKEMCRVAGEARIFPILELGARESRHVKAVTERLIDCGHSVDIETVPYEFQRGGNQMMRVRAL